MTDQRALSRLHQRGSVSALKIGKPFPSIVLAACIAALSSIGITTAQAKQECSVAAPSDSHGQWWSYRLIDGRKCWYEGKPGLSKSLLEWPKETSEQPGSSRKVTGDVTVTRPSISPSQPTEVSPQKESAPTKEVEISENRYTAGFVTGAPYSTEFAMVQEIATELASGQETGPRGEMALRVMPMVGNGGIRNILDILTLAGADMAIAPVVLVNRLAEARTFGDIRSRLVYITLLFPQEIHVLARPEIRNLRDLAGKPVNLGEEGSASAVLGREVLNRLDVKISEVNLGLEAALDGMRNGQIDATLLLSAKPVNFLARYAQSDGIHFLPIPYSPVLEDDYLPSTFRHEDYPNIIAAGETIGTIGVQSALFAYNWPIRRERFGLLELFVQTFFSRFSEFLGESHHPKWHDVNLAARLPGWQRFRSAESWLKRQSGGEAALRSKQGR